MTEKNAQTPNIKRRFHLLENLVFFILVPVTVVAVGWFIFAFPEHGVIPLYRLFTGDELNMSLKSTERR